ncbi:MAG: ParB N-terminal domain-containing protein [Pseudonocardiaceae bacterium]
MTDWPVHPVADLFPMLGGDELRELADDIAERGLIEPVWLWDDPESVTMLLDGRNRVRACELARIQVRTRRYAGNDPLGFAIAENVKRRHLNAGQLDFVALAAEPLYAAEAAKCKAQAAGQPRGAKQSSLGAGLPQENASDKPIRAPRARDRAAKVVGASGRGVAQAKRVQQEAPDLAEKVKSGGMAIDRAERIIRDREAEQKRVAKARAQAAAEPTPSTVDIRHGDFREVLADLTGIDAIITDPPYPAEFLPLLADLGAWADKVLTPDGVMAVLIGQTHLPEVYRLLDGHRPYRWTGCYLTPGNGYVSHPRKVQSSWKPLLVYGGGPRFADVIRSEGTDAGAKSLHKWGQDKDRNRLFALLRDGAVSSSERNLPAAHRQPHPQQAAG